MKRVALLFMLLVVDTSSAAAFSSPSHQAIAEVAQDRLSPTARATLGKILQGTNDVQEADDFITSRSSLGRLKD